MNPVEIVGSEKLAAMLDELAGFEKLIALYKKLWSGCLGQDFPGLEPIRVVRVWSEEFRCAIPPRRISEEACPEVPRYYTTKAESKRFHDQLDRCIARPVELHQLVVKFAPAEVPSAIYQYCMSVFQDRPRGLVSGLYAVIKAAQHVKKHWHCGVFGDILPRDDHFREPFAVWDFALDMLEILQFTPERVTPTLVAIRRQGDADPPSRAARLEALFVRWLKLQADVHEELHESY